MVDVNVATQAFARCLVLLLHERPCATLNQGLDNMNLSRIYIDYLKLTLRVMWIA